MPVQLSLTFVVSSVGVSDTLEDNFLGSPCLRKPHPHQILVRRGYISAAKAYNHAIDQAANDLLVFAHQDVIFPESWVSQLALAIERVEAKDPHWGVLGCYGATRDSGCRGYVYSPLDGIIGRPFECPAPIQTLDEIVLVIRRSSGLRFDDLLPHFHLYGSDICLRAASMGMRSYVISAFCIHNAHHYLVLPKEFYECCRHIKRVWREYLPIQTACARITRFNVPIIERRLREAHLRYIRRKAFVSPRAMDVPRLLDQVDAAIKQGSAMSHF
jgi:hypothetical protein